MNEREIAFNILESIDVDGAYSHVALSKGIPSQISKQSADFIRHIVLGVLEKRGLLDYIIQELSVKSSKRKVRQILRLAIYQILFMDRTPQHAIVDEAVRLCKKITPQSSGFVNALLRRVDPAHYLNLDFSQFSTIERLSILYSMPHWLITRWILRFGEEATEQLLIGIRKKPKLYFRINTLKGSVDDIKNELTKSCVSFVDTEFKRLVEITDLQNNQLDQYALLKEGAVSVQDFAAYLVGEALFIEPNQLILDACAAPGGKTAHLAERYPENKILSLDIYPAKVEQMAETFLRRGYKNVTCEVHDGHMDNKLWHDYFDVVIVDAPCTGLGIISRKPELPYHKKETDISDLASVQRDLLEVHSRYVRQNGYLLYATCTIEPEENEDQIRYFLSRHPEFDLCHMQDQLPERYVKAEGWVSLLPNQEHDGFYIALLKKK